MIASLAFYGALIDFFLQANYPLTRSGNPYDWLADLTGTSICFLVFFIAQRSKSENKI